MIITQTPYRISLFGGSTDYESYYEKYGSFLIGFTIDKYCYILSRYPPPIYDCLSRINYSKVERVFDNQEIEHNGVRGVLEYLDIKSGVEITHLSDLPSQTGIGSSSTFIVGLLKNIYTMQSVDVDSKKLACDAIYVERKLLKEPGGIQDQIWPSYGGFNSVEIDTSGSFEVKPMPLSQEFISELLNKSCLVYTGKTRKSFDLATQNSKISSETYKKNIHQISKDAYVAFEKKNLNEVANLLRLSWEEKKKISDNITNSIIEEIYENLKTYNMIGGKLIGSGSSGFIFAIFNNLKDKQKYLDSHRNICIDVGVSSKGSIVK